MPEIPPRVAQRMPAGVEARYLRSAALEKM
jgi:hypothetical protein